VNYAELEDKFGKGNMTKCSEFYRKYIIEQMGKKHKDVLVGLSTYLSRINPLLGGNVNTNELTEDLGEYGFLDQVVILTWYYNRMEKKKK
jgi:hypothetical protein